MTIEELKALSDTPYQGMVNSDRGDILMRLAPEILALLEAAEDIQWDYRIDAPICKAIDAFNAKLEAL